MMRYFKISEWDKHFENNRTRELKKMDWVPVPNKHDGDGFTELLDHENGMAHYGAWHLILQIASKCTPRGTLLRDGAGGVKIPHTPQSLARICRGSAVVFEAAIERLVSIGWLEVCEETAEIPHNPAPSCVEVTMEGKGREGNGTEGIYEEEHPTIPSFGEDGWELETVLKIAACPDVAVLPEMAQKCFDHYAAAEWRDRNKNEVGRTLKSLKALLRKWKVNEPSIHRPSGNTPSSQSRPPAPREKHFDEIVTDIARNLWEHRDDKEGFNRALRTWSDKTRDIPRQNGISVIDEALDIIKRKRGQKGAGNDRA